jgi:tryptophan synthase beta chain
VAWCGLGPRLADLLPPPVDAGGAPAGRAALADLLPPDLRAPGAVAAPWIDVPGAVLDALRPWRPTPLVRLRRLERALRTPARLYLKDESVAPSGSHAATSALAQAFAWRAAGAPALATASATGRWGVALAMACHAAGLGCEVHVPEAAWEQASPWRALAGQWGATCAPAPGGSLLAAVSAALRSARAGGPPVALGQVLDAVAVHETVVGLEARRQLAAAGEGLPDVVVGACTDGADPAGVALAFVDDVGVRLVAVEPAGRPVLTRGRHGYDALDEDGLAPRLARYALDGRGRWTGPGGHDLGPGVVTSALVRSGRVEAVSHPWGAVADAGALLAEVEGRVASWAAAHAARAVIDEALAAREEDVPRVVLCAWSGHGLLERSAYYARDHEH